MLKLEKTNIKKTATNKVAGIDLTYTYEVDEETQKVVNIQAHAANGSPFRVSTHFDPVGKNLAISIQDAGDDFDPALFSGIAGDLKKILKNELK